MVAKAETVSAAKDLSPLTLVTAATIFGVSLQDWALYLSITYALLRIGLIIPKYLGCARCFVKHRTCLMICKNGSLEE